MVSFFGRIQFRIRFAGKVKQPHSEQPNAELKTPYLVGVAFLSVLVTVAAVADRDVRNISWASTIHHNDNEGATEVAKLYSDLII